MKQHSLGMLKLLLVVKSLRLRRPSHSLVQSQVLVHQAALCAVWSSRAARGWVLEEYEEYAVLNILKVYRCMPEPEVACPKKDSITASNWGRFLPVLQIKSPLKLFVLVGLCPTHPPPPDKTNPPSTTNTQTHSVKL